MVGRRAVLAGALGLAALTACDTDDLRPPLDQAEPTPSPSTSTSPTSAPEPDADVLLAETVGLQIAAALMVLDDVRRTWPRLRKRLQPLVRMHHAHAEVLPAPEDRTPTVPTGPDATPGEAMDHVRQTEAALQGQLVTAATTAQSGALARLLASCSASVSQHLAALR